jgi:ABC-2 type transport system ATP-binding protein
MGPPAIETEDLTKVFDPPTHRWPPWQGGDDGDEIVAVDGVTLTVERGELFGLLGPNGAGKTTLVKMLATLLRPTSGTARVAGHDVVAEEEAVRGALGVVLGGERALYWRLTARENLWFFSQLYDMPGDEARDRIEELVELVGLDGRADERVENFSKGMKQRLHLARGLLHDPDILLLDEPTIGLDPHAAREIRSVIEERVTSRGRAVVLTTHDMHEADDLSDRVGILDEGELVALDTPTELKSRAGGDRVVELAVAKGGPDLDGVLADLPGVGEVVVDGTGGAGSPEQAYRLQARGDPDALAGEAARAVAGAGATLQRVRVVRPSLEDAFVDLTGHTIGPGGSVRR